jgi:N-acetyl-D-muramate 6-phosphate phosphatase
MKNPVFRGVRAVLFDLDGTLIDSAPDLGAAVDEMRLRRGMASKPMADYRPHVGSGARGMLQVAFGMDVQHQDYERYKEEFFGWGVVTNKAQRFTAPITLSMGLFDSASAVISGDTTPHAKPHPEPLLEAARRMSLPPAQCIYVGDDERDIRAGRSAGMWTVAARYGYLGAGADVATWGADAEVSSPLQVLQLLEPS